MNGLEMLFASQTLFSLLLGLIVAGIFELYHLLSGAVKTPRGPKGTYKSSDEGAKTHLIIFIAIFILVTIITYFMLPTISSLLVAWDIFWGFCIIVIFLVGVFALIYFIYKSKVKGNWGK